MLLLCLSPDDRNLALWAIKQFVLSPPATCAPGTIFGKDDLNDKADGEPFIFDPMVDTGQTDICFGNYKLARFTLAIAT